MVHPKIRQNIEQAIDKLQAEGGWFTPGQISRFLSNFRAKFGPEVLAGLEGAVLLHALHGFSELSRIQER